MSGNDPSIGILALKAKLITSNQLEECERLQHLGDPRPIEEILIEKRYLKVSQLSRLLNEFMKHGRISSGPETEAQPSPPKKFEVPSRLRGVRQQHPVKGQRQDTPHPRVSPFARAASQGKRCVSQTGADISAKPGSRRNLAITLGASAAILVTVMVGAVLLWPSHPVSESKTPSGPSPSPTNLSHKKVPPVEVKERPLEQPRDPHPIMAQPLSGSNELVRRWNDLVAPINSARDPIQYAALFEEVIDVLGQAAGTPYQETIQSTFEKLRDAILRRGETAWEFIHEEAERLKKAGKFADAIAAWDLFPLKLDILHDYEKRIPTLKAETRSHALNHYESIRSRSKEALENGLFTEAKNILMMALESGIREIIEDAYQHLETVLRAEDAAGAEEERRSIAEFEKSMREQKETETMADSTRQRLWELLRQRKIEAAEEFLRKERSADRARLTEYAKDLEILEGTLNEIRTLFDHARLLLSSRVGQSVTLGFIQGTVRTSLLKRIEKNRLVFGIEGKEIVESLLMLSHADLLKLAGGEGKLRSAAYLLTEDLEHAFESASPPIQAFIEKSGVFLAKNADKIKGRANHYYEAKKFERAAEEYTKLVMVPAERAYSLRRRAQSHYNAGNFLQATLDVDTLIQEGTIDPELLKILSDSYNRAALIELAKRIFEKAREKFPTDTVVLANLLKLYMQIHDYDKAREILSKSPSIAKYDPDLVSYAAILHAPPPFQGKSYRRSFERYDVETDINPELAQDIAHYMSEVYNMHSRWFPYRKNERLRFVVRVFANYDDFLRYSGEKKDPGAKLQAFYVPALKELVGYDYPELKSTLKHEAFHQFADYYVDNCPMWYNEGFASYFETSTADQAAFNPDRHAAAQSAIARKKAPSLRDLLLLSRRDWKAKGGEQEVLYYGLSWSFIYYLIQNEKKDLLVRYFEELMTGKNAQQAFDAVFSKVNLDALEARWRLKVFSEDTTYRD